jgi:hypothetical protein
MFASDPAQQGDGFIGEVREVTGILRDGSTGVTVGELK